MKTKVSTCMQVCILRETVKQEKKKKNQKYFYLILLGS